MTNPVAPLVSVSSHTYLQLVSRAGSGGGDDGDHGEMTQEAMCAAWNLIQSLDSPEVLGGLTVPQRYLVLRAFRRHVNRRMECIAQAALSHADGEALQIAMRGF